MFNLTCGAEAFGYTIDNLKSDKQREVVGLFLDFVKDWADVWSDIEPSEQIGIIHECSTLINELASLGLWVFGHRAPRSWPANSKHVALQTVTIGIYNRDNPEICKASALGDLFKHLTEELEEIQGGETLH